MSATAVLPEKPQPTHEYAQQENHDGAQYLWTCAEYHRMTESGYFDEKQVELLDGEILRMPAQMTAHAVTVGPARRIVEGVFGSGYDARIQAPITLNGNSEPEPDILVAVGAPLDYLSHHPGPSDIDLLVEVSDSTLGKDRGRKARAYARAGIAEYWIVNLVDGQLETHRDPAPEGVYQNVRVYGPEETINALGQPDADIRVADLLPPPPAPTQL